MIKKLLSLALLLALLGTLAACGQADQAANAAAAAPALAKVISEYDAPAAGGFAITAEYDANSNLLAAYRADDSSTACSEAEYNARGELLRNTGYDADGNVLWYAVFTDVIDKKTQQPKHVSLVYNAKDELQNQIPVE